MDINCNLIDIQPIYNAARKHFPDGQLDIKSKLLFCSRSGETSYYVEVRFGKIIVENEISCTRGDAFRSVLSKLESVFYVKPLY